MLLRRRRGIEEDENASDFVGPPAPVGQKKQMAWPNSTVQLLWRKGDCCVCLARFRSRFFELYVLHVVIFACWFRWYEQWWEKAGYFVADAKSSIPLFVIVSCYLFLGFVLISSTSIYLFYMSCRFCLLQM